jgi:hypothetical protein
MVEKLKMVWYDGRSYHGRVLPENGCQNREGEPMSIKDIGFFVSHHGKNGTSVVQKWGFKKKGLTAKHRKPLILLGGRGRDRTLDQLIKSQLLYQLSYTPS